MVTEREGFRKGKKGIGMVVIVASEYERVREEVEESEGQNKASKQGSTESIYFVRFSFPLIY